MAAWVKHDQPTKRSHGARLIVQLICALASLAQLDGLHAGSVAAQLRVTARVVTSCRIGMNSGAAGDFTAPPLQGSLNQRAVLTSYCTQHPGSADTMSVSTESVYGGAAKIEIISRATAGGENLSSGALDETVTREKTVTRWGIVPMNSQLLISTNTSRGAGEAPRHEPWVTLRIDY